MKRERGRQRPLQTRICTKARNPEAHVVVKVPAKREEEAPSATPPNITDEGRTNRRMSKGSGEEEESLPL